MRANEAIAELYDALKLRQKCVICGGSGTRWTLVDEEAEADACDCWIEAHDVLTKYAELRQAPAAGLAVPDEIARTIRGLLEAAIAGTKSTIRTRDYHGLRAFATTEEEWLARYDAALQWLETAPARPQPSTTNKEE